MTDELLNNPHIYNATEAQQLDKVQSVAIL